MKIKYPHTKKVEFSEIYHGTTLSDPFVWLENAKDPEVLEWVEQQNRFTENYFATSIKDDVQGLQKTLREKVIRTEYFGEYELGDKIFAGKMNGKGEMSAVILDLEYNELDIIANGNMFDNKFNIYDVSPSPNDNGLCIVSANPHGAARPSALIYNYQTKELFKQIDNCFSAVWSGDGETMYFSDAEVDHEKGININYIKTYNWKTDVTETVFIYYENSPFIMLKASRDGKYIFAQICTDYVNSKLIMIEADKKEARLLTGNIVGGFEYIGTTNHYHYVVSNDNSPFGKIIAIDASGGTYENAKIVIPECGKIIQGAIAEDEKIIVSYMNDVVSELAVFDYQGEWIKNLTLPSEMGTVAGIGGFNSTVVSPSGIIYFGFESFLIPPSRLKYNLKTDELKTAFVTEEADVKDDITVTREFIVVRDGTRVPAFIVHKKDIDLDGNNPTLMYGYGGYNHAMPPSFANFFIGMDIHEWVEKGLVYVNCNIRGGNEYGTQWHREGNLENKKNVFFDFIDITEWLIEKGWTNPKKIAICGGSNGGLLMTALTTLRPDLWGAVIASVPHTDMIRFKNDDRGPMYITEYGDPMDKELFDYMLSYSPYHNIKPAKYPAIYLQTGEFDNNVPPYHAKKFAAKMQELNQSENPILLRVIAEGSHDRGKGEEMFKTFAEMQTFIATALKL
ncbi:S9 family peptidase [Bacillus sp. Bva_UNVM-123]|uniref:prolyl oligopeptidase family serine peptidase n=1 Tax=Bacillus sp. Bva_UNVM-123 TaxID=2829798 RepID=UPI00391F811E